MSQAAWQEASEAYDQFIKDMREHDEYIELKAERDRYKRALEDISGFPLEAFPDTHRVLITIAHDALREYVWTGNAWEAIDGNDMV